MVGVVQLPVDGDAGLGKGGLGAIELVLPRHLVAVVVHGGRASLPHQRDVHAVVGVGAGEADDIAVRRPVLDVEAGDAGVEIDHRLEVAGQHDRAGEADGVDQRIVHAAQIEVAVVASPGEVAAGLRVPAAP